jgi:hypothetical protein
MKPQKKKVAFPRWTWQINPVTRAKQNLQNQPDWNYHSENSVYSVRSLK